MKNSKVFISFLFFTTSLGVVYAAAPLTHLYIGDQFLKYFHVKNRREFLLGNIYPDIRYITKEPREHTHTDTVTLEEIINEEDSFKKGSLLHSYVDIMREKIVETLHVYDFVAPFDKGFKAHLLKFVEDEYLFNKVSLFDYLQVTSTPVHEEYRENLEPRDLQKWHLFLTGYFTFKPSSQMYLLSMVSKEMFGIPAKVLYTWSSQIPKLAKDAYIIRYVDYMLATIERSFNKRKRISVTIRRGD